MLPDDSVDRYTAIPIPYLGSTCFATPSGPRLVDTWFLLPFAPCTIYAPLQHSFSIILFCVLSPTAL